MLFSAPPAAAQLIDDFSVQGQASIGGRWQWFTDQVMGGVSVGQASYIERGGDAGLLIKGDVSTANNGGFIQAALSFEGLLDASAYEGIELRIKGDGQPYHLHLRDRSTRLPWQVYTATYETTGNWQTIRVPFAAFAPYSKRGNGKVNAAALRQIGLVAGYADVEVELMVMDVRFY